MSLVTRVKSSCCCEQPFTVHPNYPNHLYAPFSRTRIGFIAVIKMSPFNMITNFAGIFTQSVNWIFNMLAIFPCCSFPCSPYVLFNNLIFSRLNTEKLRRRSFRRGFQFWRRMDSKVFNCGVTLVLLFRSKKDEWTAEKIKHSALSKETWHDYRVAGKQLLCKWLGCYRTLKIASLGWWFNEDH